MKRKSNKKGPKHPPVKSSSATSSSSSATYQLTSTPVTRSRASDLPDFRPPSSGEEENSPPPKKDKNTRRKTKSDSLSPQPGPSGLQRPQAAQGRRLPSSDDDDDDDDDDDEESPFPPQQRLVERPRQQRAAVRRRRRRKPGTAALAEIKKYQKTTELLLRKLPFARVVREIMVRTTNVVDRIQGTALLALQDAAETYIIQLFEDSLLCALHARRVTLMVRDIHLAKRLRNRFENF